MKLPRNFLLKRSLKKGNLGKKNRLFFFSSINFNVRFLIFKRICCRDTRLHKSNFKNY